MKYHEGVNIENANQAELSQFKTASFVTQIDPSKSMDLSGKKGALDLTTRFCVSETALLELFLNKFNEIDPDIIIAHDLYSTVFEILMSRLRDRGIKKWNLLSRLINVGSNEIPKFGSPPTRVRFLTKGRLVIDSLLSAQEFVSSVEYTIESLSKKLFNLEM